MITTKYKAFFDRALEGIARKIIRIGITPNQLTLLGLGLGMLSCLFLLLTRNLFVFCILISFFGLIDGLDGLVARLTHRVSRFGSYLDAMCDRYLEAVVFLSVAYVTGYWTLTFLLLTGALLTSYAKARAGMEVPVSNTEWPDFMERTERCVIYIAGLFLSQIVPKQFWGHGIFYWTLMFLVLATNFTVFQRILRARKIIRERTTASSGLPNNELRGK